MPCHAYQVSDQMICRQCAHAWDVNDPEPPACKLDPAKIGPSAPMVALMGAADEMLQASDRLRAAVTGVRDWALAQRVEARTK